MNALIEKTEYFEDFACRYGDLKTATKCQWLLKQMRFGEISSLDAAVTLNQIVLFGKYVDGDLCHC